MNFDKVREQFLKDVKDHEINVIKRDGVHRNIEFRRKGGSCVQHFGLVTWPGYLAYYGDMGEFVWWRTHDMFRFFRDPKQRINPAYWHQKLQAIDRYGGSKEFTMEKFRSRVMDDYYESFADPHNWSFSKEDLAQIKESLEDLIDEVDGHGNEHMAHSLASEWCWPDEIGKSARITLEDFWESDLRDYTYRYAWACYAIVWGIQQYDRWKTQELIRKAMHRGQAYKLPSSRIFGLPGTPAPVQRMVSAPKRGKLSAEELMDQLLEKEIERQRRWWVQQRREPVIKFPLLRRVRPNLIKQPDYPKIYGPLAPKENDDE